MDGGGSAVTLANVDELLIQCSQYHVNSQKLPDYMLFGGVRTCHELSKETQTANRRMDGAEKQDTNLYTQYGFNGVMLHNVMLNGAIGITPVRGLPENVIYAILPGEMEMLQLGDIQPIPVAFPSGDIWRRSMYTTGAANGLRETTVFRADWAWNGNTLIRTPRKNGAVLDVTAD